VTTMARVIQRGGILVPIDLHGINRGTLEILVLLAHRLDRRLLGLFLDNQRLQQVAELPFTTEIVLTSGRERGLVRNELDQRHSAVVEQTRKQLHELAARDRVELTFENAAGDRMHTALERDGHLDIFFPARQRWRLVSTGPLLPRTAPTQRVRPQPIRRLGVLLDQGRQDQKVMDTAHGLIAAGLVAQVYVLSNKGLAPEQMKQLSHTGTRACVQSNLNMEPAKITALIRNSSYDLLILPRSCLLEIPPAALDAALEETPGQVLVLN